jgi:hypothetical protein
MGIRFFCLRIHPASTALFAFSAIATPELQVVASN